MATVPVEITWTTGQVVTAAQLNSNLRDGINFLLSRPQFEGRQTVAQTLTSGAVAGVTLDVEDFDNDNGHSTSSNTSRYVAQTAGRWVVSPAVGFVSGTAAGIRQCYFDINGTAVNGSAAINQGTIANALVVAGRTKSVFLNVSDYVETLALQSSGANLNTDATADHQSTLSMRWEGTS